MYMYLSVTLEPGPWGVPSDVKRKHRPRVAWLHGLRACRMVTFYFFCCSKFYVIRVVYECTVTYIKYILYNIINN